MTGKVFKVVLMMMPGLIMQHGAGAVELAIAEQGGSLAPVIVFSNAPPFTRQAAGELAQYIEKITGSKPDVIEGLPDPAPKHAIWVGFQPKLKELFPNIDFDFKHPEEILIACDGKNLVIAGRDRWDPGRLVVKGPRNTVNGIQQEYGTANAVYTFLQDYLDVRWLWPGELGEDIIKKDKIAFAPFEYCYHPEIRARAGLFAFSVLIRHSAYGHSENWVRLQRLQLDSLYVHPGHAFKTWWERFHETHPEYFALQPDGTRGGGGKPYPSAEAVKMCESNPGVWTQWLADVDVQINENPGLTCFNASPNDGYTSGHCVCTNCRAWDQPGADLRPFMWQGLAQNYVAMSDRDVTFANTLARMLKERYPDRDYRVSMNAYGNSRPAPLKAIPDDNVVISDVANMFWDVNTPDKDGQNGKTYAQEYAGWGKVTKNQVWRPNTGNPAGWQNALPDIPIERVMESFSFAVSNHCIGIIVDSIWEQWATQGPLYYALAQMAWDPSKNWRAVMEDYYQRGFGPAAGEIKEYWKLMEEARNRKVDNYPGEANGYEEVYNHEFFAKACQLLDRAGKKAEGKPDKYKKRVEFARAGLDHMKLLSELRRLSMQMLQKGGEDAGAADLVRAKWDEVKRNCEKIPHALYWPTIRPGERMARGGLFHPDTMKSVKSKQVAQWKQPAAADAPGKAAGLEPAEKAGWELAFSDDFKRKELGNNWQILEGNWKVEDGALRGSGTLVSTLGFPGDNSPAFQRMEFEVVSDVRPEEMLGQKSAEPLPVSDFSSILHGKVDADKPDLLGSGYFFQFGWKMNKRNRISRSGQPLIADDNPSTLIVPGKTHKIVVENDGGELRMFVNGELAIAGRDAQSIHGDDHDRVGLYFFTAAKVFNVKVYTRRLSGGLDLE
ncbi:MAG: DUF4838 domain-containing protein [Kiritimatiellia bacterium]